MLVAQYKLWRQERSDIFLRQREIMNDVRWVAAFKFRRLDGSIYETYVDRYGEIEVRELE